MVVGYTARITCPLCSKTIDASTVERQQPNDDEDELVWNTSNLDVHIKAHQNYPNFEIDEEKCKH